MSEEHLKRARGDLRPLDEYVYPVYTTEVCPKNLTEWQERSSAFNCNKTNAYMCVPNENITELLEFCYSGPQIRIVKGLCMFLYKRHSTLDAYECNHFTEGCPSSNYRSQDVHIYQSCVAITNGCFLADPICNRATTTHYFINSTNSRTTERADWTWKRPLDGYVYPVYTTEVCPKNLTEWQERSSAFNCNKTNAYMCVPNENITELLEFCYSGPQIRIVKGLCMFLYKRHSTLDAYECNHFTEGCPSSNYRSQDVHIYQSCVAITNGCFLADPICNRATTTHYFINSTNSRTTERADWTWKVTFFGVTVVLFIAVCSISFRIFSKYIIDK
uniref:Uncharacterized protein n=1 Tax=Magallana gigas TaxID=29159 RepID=A0A8W8NV67_MAGGI